MPYSIKLVVASGNVFEINICIKNGLFFKNRPGNDLAKRVDDGTAATHQYDIGLIALDGVIFIEELAPGNVLTRTEDKAAPFKGHVLHRWQPLVAVIGGWGTILIDPFGFRVGSIVEPIVF